MSSRNPIVVLGGGISGLACTFYLNKLARNVIGNRKIILLEGSKRLGGWLETKTCEDGVLHELGPRSIRFNGIMGMNTISLIEEVGLGRDLLGKQSLKSRYIYAENKLNKLPSGFSGILRKQKPLLPKSLLRYTISEYRKPKLVIPDTEDISVYDFIAKRFDTHFANYFADPLLRGVTAGDARKLSMKSLFPEIYEKQVNAGSVTRGYLKGFPFEAIKHVNYDVSDLALDAKTKRWQTFNLREGLASLPEAMSEYLIRQPNVQICNESQVKSIEFNKDGVPAIITVKSAAEQEEITLDADYVISALPANRLAPILPSDISSIATKLKNIDWVNVGVVCLEYEGKKIIPEDFGFGYLVPSFEHSKLLGVTFDSCVFPEHDKRKVTRMTCMMGGEWFNKLFGSDAKEQTLEQIAIDEVSRHLGTTQDPKRVISRIHKDCIPQYRLKHLHVIRQIIDEIEERKISMDLAGFSYHGVSVNECIFYARRLVQELCENSNHAYKRDLLTNP